MRAWLPLLLLLGPSGACGDEITRTNPQDMTEAPVFAPRCGVAGPIELLPLRDAETAFRVDWAPGGERLLVGVLRISARTIVSVGPCGESPIVVAEGMELVEGYGDLVLACAALGPSLYRIDPTGAAQPTLILDGTCTVRRTDAGLVAVRQDAGGTGRLVVVRDPGAPTPVVDTLFTGVGVPDNAFFAGSDERTTPLWAKAHEAIAMTPAGDVIAVDLDTATSTVVRQGALNFRASADGTAILWQRDEALQGDPEAPTSAIVLHDRVQGTDVPIIDSHLAWAGAPFRGPWVVVRDDSGVRQRVFDRQGKELPLPSGTALRAVVDDPRMWLGRAAGERTEELLWTGSGSPRVLVEHFRGTPVRRGEGIEVFVDDEYPAAGEGSLWYGPFDGSGAVLLSPRVGERYRVLSDGRILSVVDQDAEQGVNAHGQLRLEDPDDGVVIVVAEHAYGDTPSLNAGDPFDGDIVYAVDDDASGRHALLRAAVR